jgi:hypothetical protein
VLALVQQELDTRNTADATVIVVPTDPSRYDAATGAKESLISEMLDWLTTSLCELGAVTERCRDQAPFNPRSSTPTRRAGGRMTCEIVGVAAPIDRAN